jgi:hypothetical protein
VLFGKGSENGWAEVSGRKNPEPPQHTHARRARGTAELDEYEEYANEPNAAKIDVCGCWITWCANAKTAGMTIAARAAVFSAARSGTAGDHMLG